MRDGEKTWPRYTHSTGEKRGVSPRERKTGRSGGSPGGEKGAWVRLGLGLPSEREGLTSFMEGDRLLLEQPPEKGVGRASWKATAGTSCARWGRKREREIERSKGRGGNREGEGLWFGFGFRLGFCWVRV